MSDESNHATDGLANDNVAASEQIAAASDVAASSVAAATSRDEPVEANAPAAAPADEAASVASMIAEPEPAPVAPPAPPSPPRKRSPTAAELQPPVDPEPIEHKMDWYILKVQSNREDSIRDALDRRIKIHGLQDYFGEIIVPVEMVSEFKNGKKKIVKRKLYPGYIVVRMEITEETWFLVRETPGIGDFTGSGGKPSPMLPHEVNKILAKQEEKTDEAPKLKIRFVKGDRVKITEGTFENFEGDVDSIDEANGRVTVMINIFGRSTPVELEYWQIDSV